MRPRNELRKYGKKERPEYKDGAEFFTIKMYHSGQWNEYMTKYSGGKIDYFDFCSIDKLSIIEITHMHAECGDDKGGLVKNWYKKPFVTMKNGLSSMSTDKDVMKMTELLNIKVGYMEVFVTVEKYVRIYG
ncbi:hypothetical protein POM88_048669 [Heracleum sosnowskyi]|uniref:PB1-like domain-containing protein n=1 Tax=Heracleum sosnowskyi TaxID=360622 RepID=A0AAD8M0X3_9APIA|nr:hypothetical protein POM88_048669 [Heracleum sosnowskyi]